MEYELETAVYEPSKKVRTAIDKAAFAETLTEYYSGGSIRIPTTEIAKLIRLALKETFPGTKFSVKSKKYSGGSSINIRWEDGPREIEVKPIKDFFAGATFDGMTDMTSSHPSGLVLDSPSETSIWFGVDFVFTHRTYSGEAAFKAERALRFLNDLGVGEIVNRAWREWMIPLRADPAAVGRELWLAHKVFHGSFDEAIRVALGYVNLEDLSG